MAETGLYCYALTRDLAVEALAQVAGIGGNPLRAVDGAGLAAVVSEVDLGEFGEEALRRNLESLPWLESVAVAHDGVVRALVEHAPTAPLRLATIFVSEQGVRDRLEEWREPAGRVLDRITGTREWSVKVYVDTAGADSPEPPAPPVPEGPGAGRAYLMGRRAAARTRDESMEAGLRAAETVHDRLSSASVDSRRLAPQDRKLTGHVGEMVLNGAYLVADTSADHFQETLAELTEERSVRVEAGGPWAPYSFAQLEDA